MGRVDTVELLQVLRQCGSSAITRVNPLFETLITPRIAHGAGVGQHRSAYGGGDVVQFLHAFIPSVE